MNSKSYTLVVGTKGGRIAAALCKLCQIGAPGETIVRAGITQDGFCLFLARVAKLYLDAGKSPEQLAEVFTLVSGGNASAARQAINDLTIEFEGSKATSVGSYWNSIGGNKSAPNLAALDLG